MKLFYVYILECADGTYYTGVTNNIERRFLEHSTGVDRNSYTYRRRPVKLAWYFETNIVHHAIEKEKQIKKWSQAKKRALINSDWDKLVEQSKKNFALRKIMKCKESKKN
jgi:putative endonuclease